VTRVGWVRVDVRDGTPVCHVVGTNRRRVVSRRITLARATALIASGVPSVVRRPAGRSPEPAHR
jgi:hypothetical protein